MTPRAVVLCLLAGATLFAALNVGVGWLYALGFLFVSYAVMAFGLATLALRRVRLTLRPGDRAQAGEGIPCSVALELSGRTPARYIGLLAPPIGRRGPRFFRGRLVPDGWGHALAEELAPGDRKLLTLRFPADKRGVHPLPGLVVQVPAYGLGAVHRTVRTPHEVLVRPRIHELPALPWLQSGLRDEDREGTGTLSTGAELIKTLREYRPGDPMRSVHWRSSARTGQLRIKETEGELSTGGLAIALDLSTRHTPESLEHAIEVVASLCALAHDRGIPVELWSQSGAPRLQDLESQLDWLARIPGPSSVPFPSASETGGQALVVTPGPIPGYARCLYVGEGPAPAGAIACPPGEDLVRSLGGLHGR